MNKYLKIILVAIITLVFLFLLWVSSFKIAYFIQDMWGCVFEGDVPPNIGLCVNVFDTLAAPVGFVISLLLWGAVYVFVVKKLLKKNVK